MSLPRASADVWDEEQIRVISVIRVMVVQSVGRCRHRFPHAGQRTGAAGHIAPLHVSTTKSSERISQCPLAFVHCAE